MDCGFSDSSHFARLFRRAEGVTPLDYRQAQRRRA
jgi:AraC-like DNA-binding protein